MPLKNHPLRARVVSEMHMRRMPPLGAGVQMIQVVRLVEPTDREAEFAHVTAMPGVDAGALSLDDRHVSGHAPGGAEFLWERHSEASTMTAILPHRQANPFAGEVGDEDALAWLAGAPGQVVRAVRVGVVGDEEEAARIAGTLEFSEPDLVSCTIGAARIWSDYRIHDDGFGRLLVAAGDVTPADLGRLVQRLQELGNYRNLALLGLPVVQAEAPALAALEAELVDISRRLATGAADKALLDELCALSARVAAVIDATAFRMSATAAYAQIVQDRLDGLECGCIPGFQKLDDFIDRRLFPATRTCASFVARLESLAVRIERATSLLRTRVEMAVQAQNVELLRSMERTGARQLRLQHLVEGLSVVAVSYYALSLIAYVIRALAPAMGVEIDLVEALALPVVLAVVWIYLRRRVKRIHGEDDEHA
ncbi:DUF3422 domain-containing protein [Phenylobacterium sp.]|uniref:DUF3422 domain-containing protein n=1 Tax=Phenylobacterium sp. TaxID=1871053 RepID=UPI0035AEAB5D